MEKVSFSDGGFTVNKIYLIGHRGSYAFWAKKDGTIYDAVNYGCEGGICHVGKVALDKLQKVANAYVTIAATNK